MTARPVTVSIDRAGVDKILQSPEAVDVLRKAAGFAVREAVDLAPRGFGGYRKTLRTGAAHVLDGAAAVDVESTSSFWHLVEFGSVNNPPRRVLQRAAQNTGLKFEER